MSIPNGFKLVPVEPSAEMLRVTEAIDAETFYRGEGEYELCNAGDYWGAMLAAAPALPQPIYDEVVAWEVSGNGVKPGLFNYKPAWAVEDPAYTVLELVYAKSRAKAGEDE
ncbi:hypothetical protein [Pseudomonas proteolytica]|uniref:hypothetical protein n=1 Tax=Pseudomonas proteolytica TaxID=219574 RepID=UPI0030EED7E9